MITTLLAANVLAAGATASGASDKIPLPSIRYLTILPPIIMIGGAVILLAVASLVSRPLRVRVSTIGSVVISGGASGSPSGSGATSGRTARTPTSPTRS